MKTRLVMVALTLMVTMAMAMASPVHGINCSAVPDLSPFKLCMIMVVGAAPALPSSKCCNAIKKANLSCLYTAVSASTILYLNREAALMLSKKRAVILLGLSTFRKYYGNPFARKRTDLH